MVSQKVTIINPNGLHLRPAGLFCNEAVKFDRCSITFSFGDVTGNAKSVLSVLGACIKRGDEIEIICKGENEEEALQTMVELVESGLGDKIS
ncbi:MAG: HPr family phosphocarrier protein [Lachnospiraceae bacterium]|nr:HPr family phosphocarrier protein [Lachnospiraceae bacterium]